MINDDKMAALAAKAAKTVAGEDHVITEVKAPNMGGEDFAYYLEKLPGAFMFLSSSNPAKGTDVSHHNPKFDVDEDVLCSRFSGNFRSLGWFNHFYKRRY